MQLLLERGADIAARNKQKLRPVDAAKMNGEVRGGGAGAGGGGVGWGRGEKGCHKGGRGGC